MEIWIHKGTKYWWKYWKPTCLNPISWKYYKVPKIYQWFFLGFTFNKIKENGR